VIPTWSLADLKKEVNGLIWASMKSNKKIDVGFGLTDSDENKKISRAEDTAANMLTEKFKGLDTYTTKKFKDHQTTFKNTPAELSDGWLDKWELNTKFPMWEVNDLLKTHG